MEQSCLYKGHVEHRRRTPTEHRFRYRVFSLLLDLDELPALSRQSRVLGINRAAPLSFWEKDHGASQTHGLRQWVNEKLQDAGLPAAEQVLMLCYPRILGYVFNPLTVYYCHDAAGALKAVLHEVHNTHGERHTYVLAAQVAHDGRIQQETDKRMYVSPFTPMEATYRFSLDAPGPAIRVGINLFDGDTRILSASFSGARYTLTDKALALTFVQYPLMTLKVIAGIHFEALRLWLKRVAVVPRIIRG